MTTEEPVGVPRSRTEAKQRPIQGTATPPVRTAGPDVTAANEALDAAWKEKLRLARRWGAPQDAPRPKDWRPGQ